MPSGSFTGDAVSNFIHKKTLKTRELLLKTIFLIFLPKNNVKKFSEMLFY